MLPRAQGTSVQARGQVRFCLSGVVMLRLAGARLVSILFGMSHNSEDSKDKKKTNPTAFARSLAATYPVLSETALEGLKGAWRQDLGKALVGQRVAASAVQDFMGAWRQDYGKALRGLWREDLGKALVGQRVAASAVQDFMGAWRQDYRKSIVSQMGTINSFQGLHKTLVPSQKLYEHIIDQFVPSAAIEALVDSQARLSGSQAAAVQTLSEQFLLDFTPQASEVIEDLEPVDEEELQELFQETEEQAEEPWSDPAHTWFIETAARAGQWLEEKYPHLQQQTIQTLSTFLARTLNIFIPQLVFYFGALYGIPGLLMASSIAAAVGLIDGKKKRAIDRDILLDRPCSFCDAKPGKPCVTKGGKNPGTKTAIHKARGR